MDEQNEVEKTEGSPEDDEMLKLPFNHIEIRDDSVTVWKNGVRRDFVELKVVLPLILRGNIGN